MNTKAQNPNTEVATFGAGCFWCVEAIFEQLKGVEKVESGYSGGDTPNPTYKEVCSGSTGHAEVVQITFDNSVISYRELLKVFFEVHNPTTLNRQGNDIGTQYRSVIFYHNFNQQKEANLVIKKLTDDDVFANRIVTQVNSFTAFYKAENYHQDYYNQNGEQPYCNLVIKPKLKKFEKTFKELLKKK
jgi:peptide-methionine (S)-S-oxide reductase